MVAEHLITKLSALLPITGKFAIAFSGGGDSTALVHALKGHPRRGPVFIVDHQLRAESAAEALYAKAFAESCGYPVSILKWSHNNPKTGLQEKARRARYGLLGEACRKHRIEHLLTAHSEDDQAETDWRGAAGMAEQTYAPVWSELAMVNLVRPLLGISRKALREYNTHHGLSWSEDPSNQNRDYARIRARDYLSKNLTIKAELLETAKHLREGLLGERGLILNEAKRIVRLDKYGIIYLSAIPSSELLRELIHVAGGGGQVIDREKVKRLRQNMTTSDFKAGTLAGALLKPQKDGFFICRDLSAVKGRKDSVTRQGVKAKNLSFQPYPRIWDGRYVLNCRDGTECNDIRSIYHCASDLRPDHRQALKDVPPDARLTIPVVNFSGMPAHIAPYKGSEISFTSIVRSRLEALLGGEVP